MTTDDLQARYTALLQQTRKLHLDVLETTLRAYAEAGFTRLLNWGTRGEAVRRRFGEPFVLGFTPVREDADLVQRLMREDGFEAHPDVARTDQVRQALGHWRDVLHQDVLATLLYHERADDLPGVSWVPLPSYDRRPRRDALVIDTAAALAGFDVWRTTLGDTTVGRTWPA